jgi:F-type H+-transporting ATPase subunit alpha
MKLKDIISNIPTKHGLFEKSVGFVHAVNNGVATVVGLLDAKYYEVVVFANGLEGLIISMTEYYCNVAVLSNKVVFCGMEVTRSGHQLSVKTSLAMIGKCLNGYGHGCDVGDDYELCQLERSPLGMLDIKRVNEQMVTGVCAIDWFCPIGYGQREAIASSKFIGEDLIIKFIMNNLKERPNTFFIYCGIGQKVDFASDLYSYIKKSQIENFIMFVANASDEAIARYLCPYTACAVAEYFKNLGKDVVIFYHDLTQHAIAHREVSLITKMAVGREAYPADITYIHSRLLERAACFENGSITAIPFVVVEGGDLSGSFVPNNVISITDGQILLSDDKFKKGLTPPIDIPQSVSRIGSGIQNKYLRKLCGDLKLKMARAEQVYNFSQFSDSKNSDEISLLNLRERVLDFINQELPYPLFLQILVLYGISHDCINIEKPKFLERASKFVNLSKDICAGDQQIISSIFAKINIG